MSSEGLSEGVTFEELTSEVSKEFLKHQKGHPTGFVRLQPYNQVMPRSYLKYEKAMKTFEVRDDDVWVITFPKCGTTWTQEMVWLVMNGCDTDKAKKSLLDERVPFLELIGLVDPELTKARGFEMPNMIEGAKKMSSPRVMKSHLTLDMLPNDITKKGKIIYVIRNPRDACMSFLNHWRALEGFTGDLELFAKAFINGECGYNTPVIQHMLGYWDESHKPGSNVMVIMYEDMKRDLASVLRKVGHFLERPVPEDKMDQLVKHLSFDEMKNNPMTNKQEFVELSNKVYDQTFDSKAFMRQGKAGTWREAMSPEIIKKFEEWEKKELAGSTLSFQYN